MPRKKEIRFTNHTLASIEKKYIKKGSKNTPVTSTSTQNASVATELATNSATHAQQTQKKNSNYILKSPIRKKGIREKKQWEKEQLFKFSVQDNLFVEATEQLQAQVESYLSGNKPMNTQGLLANSDESVFASNNKPKPTMMDVYCAHANIDRSLLNNSIVLRTAIVTPSVLTTTIPATTIHYKENIQFSPVENKLTVKPILCSPTRITREQLVDKFLNYPLKHLSAEQLLFFVPESTEQAISQDNFSASPANSLN